MNVGAHLLAHTALVASILAPLASGTGCPGDEAPAHAAMRRLLRSR